MQSRDFIENSDDFLQSLLIQSTESEKLHTEYLFQHGHYSSAKLPNCNSINFKCQQKIEQDKNRPFHYSRFGIRSFKNRQNVNFVFENFFLAKIIADHMYFHMVYHTSL